MISDLLFRLRAIFSRRSLESELDAELRAHLDREAEKLVATGLSVEEASKRARTALGGLEQTKEDCRDARGTRVLEDLGADVRYAVRTLRKSPAFSLTAILMLAVGIGANTGLFTLINMWLLRPVPVRDPSSLYQVFGYGPKRLIFGAFSFQEYRLVEAGGATVFAEVMADSQVRAKSLGRTSGGYLVSGNYFSMLGAGMVLGRPIQPDDGKGSAPPVVVLSHAAWQSAFAGDPQIVGKQIELAGSNFAVIGVATPGFTGMDPFIPDFWAPIKAKPLLSRNLAATSAESEDRSLRIIGRLRPNVAPEQAESAVSALLPQVAKSRPIEVRLNGGRLQSRATYQPWNHADLANVIAIVTAFALILLIACSNLGNVLLARALTRQREIGLRLSLGASRGRIIRQLLTESAVIGLCAGLLGLALSHAAWTSIRSVLMSSLSGKSGMSVVEITPDYRVFVFTFSLSLAAGVLFGLVPAWNATRVALASALKAEGSSLGLAVRSSRFRDSLVVVQFALSLVLLAGAGLLLQSATRFQAVEPGFDVEHGISVQTVQGTATADPALQRRLVERLRAVPGVHSVALALREPLRGSLPKGRISVGKDDPTDLTASYNEVSPEYFAVLGIPLLRGRAFTAQEISSGAGVALISQSTAKRLWPNEDPIGSTIRVTTALLASGGREGFQNTFQAVQVIGIVKDVVSAWLWDGPDETCIYLPAKGGQAQYYSILLRGNLRAKQLVSAIRVAVNAADPTVEFDVRTMDEVIEFQVLPFRLAAWGAAAIGGLGLLLASIGIYGVMAYGLSQRTKEIGIRMALGADRLDLLRMMLRDGGRLVGIGIAFGLGLAFAFSRLLGAMIFKVRSSDPTAFAMASLALGSIGILAVLLPSIRASRMDANVALRNE